MSKVSVYQINQTELALAIQQYSSGAAFSGNLIAYVQNSGWLGNGVLNLSGGAQTALGPTTFAQAITVPYAGGTGQSVARLYVDNSVTSASGALNSSLNIISGTVRSGSASITVTGSAPISAANITGLGGTLVIYSGGQLFISGAAAGAGGGSNVLVTGSSAISTPNLTGLGSVTVSYNGTFVMISGTASAGGGGGAPDAVFQTGNQNISGLKTFTGSVQLAAPTTPSGAVNLIYLSGFSGVMTGTIQATSGILTAFIQTTSGALTGLIQSTSGVLYARTTGISGALQTLINAAGGGGTTTNVAITGTGTINSTFNASGNMTNTISVSGNMTNTFSATGTFNNTFNGPTTNNTVLGTVTGNFVNLSFFFEAYNLNTGLNQVEAFVARTFTFTGYAVGAQTSGTQGFFSGSIYQRLTDGSKVTFRDFSYNSGQFFTGVGGLSQPISGMNRIGIDILRLGTGMTGVTVGVFGVGY